MNTGYMVVSIAEGGVWLFNTVLRGNRHVTCLGTNATFPNKLSKVKFSLPSDDYIVSV